MSFLVQLWPLGVAAGTLMISGSVLTITYLYQRTEDDGLLETQSCPPHIQRQRRMGLVLVVVGTVGLWILTGSLVLASLAN